MNKKNLNIPKSVCPVCSYHIPKRVTYLYEESLNGWICKSCWHQKYDSKIDNLKVKNG